MRTFKFLLFYIAFVAILLKVRSHNTWCTSQYGRQVCSFVPAPPGETPSCAQPGHTYCEHPYTYPGERIKYLVQQWRLDHSSILRDETQEDFNSNYPPPVYGPPNFQQPQFYSTEPIHIPKPSTPFSFTPGNTYIPPRVYNGSLTRAPEIQTYRYSSDIPPTSPRYVYGPPNLYTQLSLPHENGFVKIWNRKDDEAKQGKVLIRKRREFLNSTRINNREKRQAGEQTLCQTRSQYIMPRAALNNKGNWMYVVNMPEVDNNLSQLVKSETCASQACSGLCGLPLGYTSRCEQKYVQKRLVALGGAGDDLYTDVFWFPSCCVCTISNG